MNVRPDGATSTERMRTSTEQEQMSQRSFYRVQGFLEENELVRHDEEIGLYVACVRSIEPTAVGRHTCQSLTCGKKLPQAELTATTATV